MPVVWADHLHRYTDRNPISYENVRNELRERCSLSKSIRRGVMAVHIRMGDVANDPKNADRRTPFDQILKVIERARQSNPGLDVNIYSEGEEGEFCDFTDCQLHLGTDVFETLDGLINAESLVMAKSSFSYVAGILSRGTVVYDAFWHPRLPSWGSVDDYLCA